MSDAFTRLAAADPYARKPFVVNVDDLISRVTRTSPHEKALWRRFQLRVGTALGTSALVTAGAIAVLQGAGSSLPVLNFAASVTHSGFTTAVPFKSDVAATSSTAPTRHFRAGPALSSAPSRAAAYQLSAPANPAGETARLASVFQVHGPLSASSNKTIWRINDATSTLIYFNVAIPSWRYARATSPVSGPGALALPTHALETSARDLASRLGYGYQLASPHVSFVTPSSPEEHVRFPIEVGGVATNLSLTFNYDARGILVGASGPSFQVARSYLYPLVSTRTGVARLNASPPSFRTDHPGDSAQTLRRATLSLKAFRLHTGSLWLVPIYTYDEGPHARTASWSLVALAGRYVRHATGLDPAPLAQP